MNNSANIAEVCKFERRGDLALPHPVLLVLERYESRIFAQKN